MLKHSNGSVGLEIRLSTMASLTLQRQRRFRPQLPEGYSRSYAGLLLRNQQREVEVDQAIVRHEMEYLSQFMVIAFFLGRKPSKVQMSTWLAQL
jgi:hypothetical protein